MLAVAAIGTDGLRAPDSQLAGYLAVAAPGLRVTAGVAGTGGQADTFSGTSYAAPFVAGTAALIRQRWPELSGAEVAQRIIATADPAPGPGHSTGYGYGILNPYRAVTESLGWSAGPRPAEPAVTAGAPTTRHGGGSRGPALVLAAVGVTVAVLVVLLASVLSRGSRRGWRPGG